MKIAIWKTGHEIADKVAHAISESVQHTDHTLTCYCSPINEEKLNEIPRYSAHIGYGILREMDQVFKRSAHWFNVDRGYFNPRHFDGYYRISYRGTQAKFNELRKPWQGELQPWRQQTPHALICPPTEAVCNFFAIDKESWTKWAISEARQVGDFTVRDKKETNPIDWDSYDSVITFNSSVGWKALQMGIPVLSDVNHSIIGSHYGITELHKLTKFLQKMPDSRQELFECMNAHQFTLNEIRAGKAWQLINHYLSISDMMTAKQLPPKFVSTPSFNALKARFQSNT